MVAKAMLVKDSKGKVPFYLAILSASAKFNSKQFKKITKMKSNAFANEQEIIDVTGSPMGAVSPFGSIFNVPVWVDRSLSKNTEISFNCGLRTESIVMTYEDYIAAE